MTIRTQIMGGLSVAVATLLIACTAVGGSRFPAKEFAQANDAYGRADYTTAVHDYRALLERDEYSVPVLYNLGNAWLQLNQPGRAILNYERALYLAPSNTAVTHNLHIAEVRSGHLAQPSTLRAQILAGLRLDALIWVATGAAVALAAAVLLGRRRGAPRARMRRTIAVASALLLLVCGALVFARLPELDRAVVIAPATAARVAPADAAEVAFVLQSGDFVQLGRPYDAFVRVHAQDGRSAWVRAAQVARILGSP